MKTIIITASDENFLGFTNGLLNSLHQFDKPLSDAIGVLDLGLSEESLKGLEKKVNYIVKPTWNLKVNEDVAKKKPYLRALTSRPFLPDYFPGYDLYLWLDADTWVQKKFAIDWLFQAASVTSMSAVPHVHQSYQQIPNIISWRMQILFAYYGDRTIDLYHNNVHYNAGIFCLKKDAPHWQLWADSFQKGLTNCDSKFVCDQAALNYTIWSHDLPIHPLPAICNWCCHLALPSIDKDSGKFCEPHIPHREIGIMHISSKSKQVAEKLRFKS